MMSRGADVRQCFRVGRVEGACILHLLTANGCFNFLPIPYCFFFLFFLEWHGWERGVQEFSPENKSYFGFFSLLCNKQQAR